MTTSTLTDYFACGHAASASWRAAAEAALAQCGPGVRGATLGFVYATDAFADDYADIVEFLRRRTGIAHWVGTVGLGVCGSGREYLDEPAIALLCCSFPEDAFRIFSGLKAPRDATKAKLQCGGGPAAFAVVHADPATPSLTSLVREFAARTGSGFIVGGLTSSRGRAVQYADGLTDGGLSGVIFSDDIVIATRLTQACAPVGPKHVVTDARSNILVSLDGRPALDVFREDIGSELSGDLGLVAGRIFVGLPIEGSDTGDYLVRNLVGLDSTHKLLAVGETMRPGRSIVFCRRDRGTASDDLDRMLTSIRSGLFREPKGGVYFSCLGRGASLFGENSEELRIIRDRLGEVPIVGFFCNGEISHNRLYGYTGVLTLFM
ncbi:MAG TPA: FIST N-terminal domain-containing protein [Burkholderiales bacterium]|nr:FIST N-terminal domain-containing protein [Burkholderiales bacterium]